MVFAQSISVVFQTPQDPVIASKTAVVCLDLNRGGDFKV